MKPTVDEYIQKSEPFAQPILNHLRDLVHRTCPNIDEAIKWGFPFFVYKGANLAYMAGFKQHATFGFGLASHMKDAHKVFVREEGKGMGNFGKLSDVSQLPSDEILIEYLHEAMLLHDQGFKQVASKKTAPKLLPTDDAFASKLKESKTLSQFKTFSISQQNEYNEWISDAKTETTRDKRIADAIEWISEGKPRNWKYMKKWAEK